VGAPAPCSVRAASGVLPTGGPGWRVAPGDLAAPVVVRSSGPPRPAAAAAGPRAIAGPGGPAGERWGRRRCPSGPGARRRGRIRAAGRRPPVAGPLAAAGSRVSPARARADDPRAGDAGGAGRPGGAGGRDARGCRQNTLPPDHAVPRRRRAVPAGGLGGVHGRRRRRRSRRRVVGGRPAAAMRTPPEAVRNTTSSGASRRRCEVRRVMPPASACRAGMASGQRWFRAVLPS
jgi:hypothetical protein